MMPVYTIHYAAKGEGAIEVAHTNLPNAAAAEKRLRDLTRDPKSAPGRYWVNDETGVPLYGVLVVDREEPVRIFQRYDPTDPRQQTGGTIDPHCDKCRRSHPRLWRDGKTCGECRGEYVFTGQTKIVRSTSGGTMPWRRN
jgi:hypothetical protein